MFRHGASIDLRGKSFPGEKSRSVEPHSSPKSPLPNTRFYVLIHIQLFVDIPVKLGV